MITASQSSIFRYGPRRHISTELLAATPFNREVLGPATDKTTVTSRTVATVDRLIRLGAEYVLKLSHFNKILV
jgi:hypothetical protein